jgi:hypothetical protein
MLKSNTISLKIYYNITLYIHFKDTMIFIYYYVTIKNTECRNLITRRASKKISEKTEIRAESP